MELFERISEFKEWDKVEIDFEQFDDRSSRLPICVYTIGEGKIYFCLKDYVDDEKTGIFAVNVIAHNAGTIRLN